MKILISMLLASTLLLSCIKQQNSETKKSSQTHNHEIKSLRQRVESLNERLNNANKNSEPANIDQIRVEIHEATQALDEQINEKLTELNSRLDEHQTRITELEENQLTPEQVRLLLLSFEEQYAQKERSLRIQLNASHSDEEKSEIFLRLSQLAEETQQFRAEFREFQTKGVELWEAQLQETLNESEGRITEEVKALLEQELLRLKVSQEALRTELENITKTDDLNIMNPSNLDDLKVELNEAIENRISLYFEETPEVVGDIIAKLFEPCTTSLKEDPYCYTSGALIHKLGGQFIDPTKFEKTKLDLVTYLSLSGIKLKASLNEVDKYITSSMPNLFARCFPGETKLIAPQKYWPRLVIISLIFEKIETDINLKKEMGLISDEVAPITHFVAWYRNLCYQQGITGRQNVNSDHMYGAALDASFVSQNSRKTFEHYRDFIQDHIIDNDVFGIVHPLKSSNLTISVGLGHGNGSHGRGKLHLGIMSEIDGGDGIRTWTY